MKLSNFISIGGKKEGGAVRALRTRGASALLHWETLLGLFFAMLIFAFTSGYFIFHDIDKGNFSFTALKGDDGSAKLTTVLLEKTVGAFDTKRATFEQIEKKTVIYSDPSI